MRAVADEQIAVDLYTSIAQSSNFFQKCNRIQNNAITDDTAAAFAQHAARNQLQDKSLTVDDDGVASVVPACIACYHGELLRQHINDFAFALVAPLRAHDDRGLALAQFNTPISPRTIRRVSSVGN